MSDLNENSPNDVLRQQDPNNPLYTEVQSLRAKLAAMERKNVIDGGFTGTAPRYLINERCYFEDTLYEPGTVLDFFGEPNLSMVPQNEQAQRAMKEHIDRLERGARAKARQSGREYYGLVTDRNNLIDMARLDAQNEADAPVPVIQVPVPIGNVPAMPHLQEAQMQQKRGPGRPRKVVSSTPPADRASPVPSPMTAPYDPNGPAIVGHRVA